MCEWPPRAAWKASAFPNSAITVCRAAAITPRPKSLSPPHGGVGHKKTRNTTMKSFALASAFVALSALGAVAQEAPVALPSSISAQILNLGPGADLTALTNVQYAQLGHLLRRLQEHPHRFGHGTGRQGHPERSVSRNDSARTHRPENSPPACVPYNTASTARFSRATVASTSFSLSRPNRPNRKVLNSAPSPTCNGTPAAICNPSARNFAPDCTSGSWV